MSHKHEKVTTYRKQPSGDINITTSSYYEELSHELIEVEKPHTNLDVQTAKDTVDRALERITSKDSPQTVLTIKSDNRGRGGIKIVERYVLSKKSMK